MKQTLKNLALKGAGAPKAAPELTLSADSLLRMSPAGHRFGLFESIGSILDIGATSIKRHRLSSQEEDFRVLQEDVRALQKDLEIVLERHRKHLSLPER